MFHWIILIANAVALFDELSGSLAAELFRYDRIMFTVLDLEGNCFIHFTVFNDIGGGKVGGHGKQSAEWFIVAECHLISYCAAL